MSSVVDTADRGDLLEAIRQEVYALDEMDDDEKARISISLKTLPTEVLRDIWETKAWKAVAFAAGVLADVDEEDD